MTDTSTPAPLLEAQRLREALGAEAAAVLDSLVLELGEDPARISRILPTAARRTRRGLLVDDGAGSPVLSEDAVRVELVLAAAAGLEVGPLESELAALYRFGDNDEKRAVLLAVDRLVERIAVPVLVQDALRTNDPRLVRAAMGEQAARHLDLEHWRQGVLKCLFTGVELRHVAGLADRCDLEVARMAARYAHERVAAGRAVPADVWLLLEPFPAALVSAGLDAELASEHDDRRDAARRFLDQRPPHHQED